LGVTQLVDRILQPPKIKDAKATDIRPEDVGPLELPLLDRNQVRDLLLLAAFYDQSSAETFRSRWHRLRKKLKFRIWRTRWHVTLGILSTLTVFGLIVSLQKWDWLASPWPYLFAAAGWIPWLVRSVRWYWRARGITRRLRVVNHEANPLRQ